MFKRIAVLGAGTMGIGIAHFFAQSHYNVSLFEPKGDLAALSQLNPSTNLTVTNNLQQAVAGADLIIESVPEQLAIKLEVYNQLLPFIGTDTIIASNTSTFALQTLADGSSFGDRLVIMHFFNPALLIPLVEIVALPATRPSIVARVQDLLIACGKKPVVLKRDIPGFLANRLQAALMREACYLLENGYADAAQLDSVVKDGLGLRYAFKGPFEIADLGGLDVWAKVTGHLFPELGTQSETPPTLQMKSLAGELGVKTGSGFYSYEQAEAAALQMKAQIHSLVALKNKQSIDCFITDAHI